MGVDGLQGNRVGGINLPAKNLAVVIAGKKPASLESQGANPAPVTGERGALSRRQVPALHGVILRPREDEAARRVEAATQGRAGIAQILDHARASRVEWPGRGCLGQDLARNEG